MVNMIKLACGLVLALMLGGCSCGPFKAAAVSGEDAGLRSALNEYLAHYTGAAGFGGVVFADYDVVRKDDNAALSRNYIWVVCQEYYVADGKIRRGTEVSVPAEITLARSVNDYRVLEFKMPVRADNPGTVRNAPRIQKLSPEYDGYNINERTTVMESALLERAVKYFEVCLK